MRTSKALCDLFYLSSSELKEKMDKNKVMYPITYFRQLPDHAIVFIVGEMGSLDRAAEELGLSKSFLIKEMKARMPTRVLSRGEMTFDIAEELTRLGSVSLVAAVHKVKESEIRKVALERGVDVCENQRLEKRGNFAVGKGRKAELAYMSRRSDFILEDMTLKDTQAPYDVGDRDFGRVNVKGSRRHKSSGREFAWKFSLSGKETCDYFAFMLFDSRWGNDSYCVVMLADVAVKLQLSSITLHSRIFNGVSLKDKRLFFLRVEDRKGVDGIVGIN